MCNSSACYNEAMKEKSLEIYDLQRENGDRFILTATLSKKGELSFDGVDYTSLGKKMFHDIEFEYGYYFSQEETEKLSYLFKTKDLLIAIKEFFHGEIRNTDFLNLCKENNIAYKTWTYV